MNTILPERINLAIGNSCYVKCPGCYQMFGNKAPRLDLILKSVTEFYRLGIRKVTISGGDPLLIDNFLSFLSDVKAVGFSDVKVDTVGLGLLKFDQHESVMGLDESKTKRLLQLVSSLGLPLDGWDARSLLKFRVGRPNLFNELKNLLSDISSIHDKRFITINTVLHAKNYHGLSKLHQLISRFPVVNEWHIFQYTPTDQVGLRANSNYNISDSLFQRTKDQILDFVKSKSSEFVTQIHSNQDRLGWYLLINSDGNAWIPNEKGTTVHLGSVYGNESEIVNKWNFEVNKTSIPLML